MEALGNSLFLDGMPESWAKRAYPSLYGLTQWYADLLLRIKELETWVSDFQLPAAVWLAGFFNPQSFLTAIMQQVSKELMESCKCGGLRHEIVSMCFVCVASGVLCLSS